MEHVKIQTNEQSTSFPSGSYENLPSTADSHPFLHAEDAMPIAEDSPAKKVKFAIPNNAILLDSVLDHGAEEVVDFRVAGVPSTTPSF